MIASLPMYARAETHSANNRLWALIRDALGDGPAELNASTDWENPNLLLSQTCGLPYRLGLHAHVTLVAAPVHNLPLTPGFYNSVIVAKADDPRDDFRSFDGAHLAINAANSQSGWAAPALMARAEGIDFSGVSVTGAHLNSAKAVADGKADLACIDAVSWEMMMRWDAFTRGLRVVTETLPTRALPYITAMPKQAARLRTALAEALQSLSPENRDTLCLTGIIDVVPNDYLSEPIPPKPCLCDQNP